MSDFSFIIHTADSRRSQQWRRREVSWREFKAMCSASKETWETAERYAAMGKDERAEIKDCGGFVFAELSGPRRRGDSVMATTGIPLDLDSARDPEEVCAALERELPGAAWLVYSSHSHTPERPKLRVCIPFKSRLAPELHEPVARMAASLIGIEMADKTTYERERMFFWPSHPKGSAPFFRAQDGEPLDWRFLLAMYNGLHCDPQAWPRAEGEGAPRPGAPSRGARVENPLAKPGIVGAFCRAHCPIAPAMEELIPGVYLPAPKAGRGRYTYCGGTTSGAAVAAPWRGEGGETEQECLLFSHHQSDPAGLCSNIWDLVRVHRFGGDERAMAEFAERDPATRELMAREAEASAAADLSGLDLDGFEPPEPRRRGRPPREGAIARAFALLSGEPFSSALRLNSFLGVREVWGELPWPREGRCWSDADDSCLNAWMEERGVTSRPAIRDALQMAYAHRSYHPVREYLDSLKWDGKPRLERLFVSYLGAEDCPLNRAATRLHFAAAVARARDPGVKYDHCLVLFGEQGCGKSTSIAVMAGDWFSDSEIDFGSKEAYASLDGVWLKEFAEMSSMRRAEVETVKSFISARADRYRKPYARNSELYPRQCVFFGTTNDRLFLKGREGNRRFFVIEIDPSMREHPAEASEGSPSYLDALARDRDQLWAEADEIYRREYAGGKAPLALAPDMEAEMRRRQEGYNEEAVDPMQGLLEAFLAQRLPLDWDGWTLDRRRQFWRDPESATQFFDERPRASFCIPEFVCEFLGRERADREYRAVALKVAKIADAMPGWVNVGTTRDAKIYGVQKTYRRRGAAEPEPGFGFDL